MANSVSSSPGRCAPPTTTSWPSARLHQTGWPSSTSCSSTGSGSRPPVPAPPGPTASAAGARGGPPVRAALGLIRRGGPELLVCAVPVGPPSIIDLIAHEVDEVVCPVQPDRLWAVAEWYEDFAQVSDETVKGLLGRGGEV